MRFVFRPFWKILSLSSLCFWALPPSPATNSAFSHSLTQFSTYVHDTKWTWVLTLKKLHYPRNPVFMQFHRKVYMQSFQHTLNITNNTRNTVCKVNDYLDNLMTQIFSKKYFPFTLAPTNTYSKNWEKISLVFHRKIIWWIVWWLYIWWLWNIARNIEKEAPIILLIVCHFSCIVALDILLPPAQPAPGKTRKVLKGGISIKQHHFIKTTCLICHTICYLGRKMNNKELAIKMLHLLPHPSSTNRKNSDK